MAGVAHRTLVADVGDLLGAADPEALQTDAPEPGRIEIAADERGDVVVADIVAELRVEVIHVRRPGGRTGDHSVGKPVEEAARDRHESADRGQDLPALTDAGLDDGVEQIPLDPLNKGEVLDE